LRHPANDIASILQPQPYQLQTLLADKFSELLQSSMGMGALAINH